MCKCEPQKALILFVPWQFLLVGRRSTTFLFVPVLLWIMNCGGLWMAELYFSVILNLCRLWTLPLLNQRSAVRITLDFSESLLLTVHLSPVILGLNFWKITRAHWMVNTQMWNFTWNDLCDTHCLRLGMYSSQSCVNIYLLFKLKLTLLYLSASDFDTWL